MGLTRIRSDLQLAADSVTSDRVKNETILNEDIAPLTITGDKLVDASVDGGKLVLDSVTKDQIDVASIAGEGLVENPTTGMLDVNIDEDTLSIIADKIETDALNITKEGNVFNNPDQLVKLLDTVVSPPLLPVLDGANLVGVMHGGSNFVDLDEPTGDIDGLNVTYVLANTPISGSVHLFFNGVLQRPGPGNDYEISGVTITMDTPLHAGDVLIANYRV